MAAVKNGYCHIFWTLPAEGTTNPSPGFGNTCYLAATFLPGINVLRWPDPEHRYKDSCYSTIVDTARFSYSYALSFLLKSFYVKKIKSKKEWSQLYKG